MKFKDLFWVFVAMLVALAINTEIQKSRASMKTVSIVYANDLNSPGIDISIPIVSYFDGGSENQLFVFTSKSDNDQDWVLDFAIGDVGMGLRGKIENTKYLIVCAPKTLSGEQALDYMWKRYHPTDWHVDWTGLNNLPGTVNITCQ